MIVLDFITGIGIALAIEAAGLLAMVVLLMALAALWEAVDWLLR